jgi:hypothetical protein
LNGTLVFDLANTNQLTLLTYPTNPLTFYYSGNLNVINSGVAPVAGKTYKLFNDTNGYGGSFTATSYPPLSGGLSWVDNLATSGSISVIGAMVPPLLTISQNGANLTLSWDSVTYPGYSVQAQTNANGIGSNWAPTGSGTTSPYHTTLNPANRAVVYRLSNP